MRPTLACMVQCTEYGMILYLRVTEAKRERERKKVRGGRKEKKDRTDFPQSIRRFPSRKYRRAVREDLNYKRKF